MGERADGAASIGVESTEQDGVLVTVVSGEVDMTNADRVRQEIETRLDERPVGLVVDLDVAFLGSAGLSVLVDLHRRAQRNGVPFVLVMASTAARRPVVATALDQVIPLAASVPEAIAVLREASSASERGR